MLRPARQRRTLRLLLVLLVLAYFFLPWRDLVPSGALTLLAPAAAAARTHPIDTLIADGHARWQAKLQRQSTTLDQAVKEYRRRYGREPPKGYDAWFAFARKNDFKLIDEFDAIDEDLALFRPLTSAEFRHRTNQAMVQETAYGITVASNVPTIIDECVEGGQKRGEKRRAAGFVKMMRSYLGKLPADVGFAVSGIPENNVLAPWETTQKHNQTLELPDITPYITVRNEFALWHKFTNSCHPASPVRYHADRYVWPAKSAMPPPQVGVDPAAFGGVSLEQAKGSRQMAFLERTEAHEDLCEIEPERFYQFGSMYSGFPAFVEAYPVLGPARSPGTIEIRVPSSFYAYDSPSYTYGYDKETGLTDDENPKDPQWEEKEDTVYWRGSTAGGGNTPSGLYANFHRHRLVQLAVQPSNLSIPLVHRTSSGTYEATLTPVEDLRPALDIAFTRIMQCEPYPGKCEQMAKDYKLGEWADFNASFKSKMIFDSDGRGYSARFIALLASRSAPVKASIYREFFDDWLEPWVHYIPVSSHYQELFNVWAYFLADATPKGDAALRRIAEDSRAARYAHLRAVDLEIYTYLLTLEMSRLWNKDFEDMDYHHPA